MTNDALRIAVVAATYNRRATLVAMLDGIEAQDLPTHVRLRVVIVDNSNDANARAYVEKRATKYQWPLVYHHEQQRGISFARNTGLRDAVDAGDHYVAFIDDDERPRSDWIGELLKVAGETGAPVIIGAVKAVFEKAPPWWIEAGRFLDTTDFADRTIINYGHTGNALVDVCCVRNLNLEFSTAYALTGGEDTVFFKAIRDNGGVMVFARNAVTFEHIAPKRATFQSLVKYWFRTGNTDGLIKRRSSGSGVRTLLSLIIQGLIRIAVGAMGATLTTPWLLAKRVYSFEYIRITCRGVGYLASAANVAFEQYRKHDR